MNLLDCLLVECIAAAVLVIYALFPLMRIMWDKIEPFSDRCDMSFASDVMPLSDVSETSNYVQAQFDASNASHSTSDMPVDSLVGCSADVGLSSVDRGVQTENDNTYVNMLLHRIDALENTE